MLTNPIYSKIMPLPYAYARLLITAAIQTASEKCEKNELLSNN